MHNGACRLIAFAATAATAALAACDAGQRRADAPNYAPRLDGLWMLESLDGRALPARSEVEPCDARPYFSQVHVRDGRWVQTDSARPDCGDGSEVLASTFEQEVELSHDTVFALDASGPAAPARRRMVAFYYGDSLKLFGNDMVAAHWIFHRQE